MLEECLNLRESFYTYFIYIYIYILNVFLKLFFKIYSFIKYIKKI